MVANTISRVSVLPVGPVNPVLARRGFLPAQDPAQSFPPGSELSILDEVGRDLPQRLEHSEFRRCLRELRIPDWPEDHLREETLPELRLYYVRVGFLASAYINQVSQPPVDVLPRNLAIPLCKACELLGRPPILSYDGYALYNWKRLDPNGPIALGNIDTLQNFVPLYDEHWFILVHVEIEAIAADILEAIDRAARARNHGDAEQVTGALRDIARSVWKQVDVLRRIPEKMDPALYYRTFRPYIRFFENVIYEGVAHSPMSFRGETGAQSSIMPTLIAFMKIRHCQSVLTDHLADMRRFMPLEHRQLIADIEALPSMRDIADPLVHNDVLEAMATFREVHYGWAQEYINRRVQDPRGTGGTPYMTWLRQLIDETRDHKLPA
ncbi:MAG: preprotein translocase subunit Tim44 [Acidobacteria bacterium]|nr:MAG: preprotein translocase subunit Tim44 [Acidobacteriota bacterium]